MKYVTDQMLARLAKRLQERDVECETITKLIHGNEDSSVSVPDPEIVRFMKESKGEWTLITMDGELAEYCKLDDLPHINVLDLVVEKVTSGEPRGL